MVFDLTFIWAVILATGVFLYVAMDGFDLGVGILFPFLKEKQERDTIVNSVAPFWDGNETWLVLGGGGMLAVFPLAYAVIMPALYMPIILMLLALVFRGVAFEMRFKAETARHQMLWDAAFSGGSFAAAFCQGIILGAFVQGIKVADRAYAGGWWDWLTAFSVFTGVAVVVGYALLGACWLVWKTEGPLQDRARGLAKCAGFATLGFIGAVSAIMPFLQPAFHERWLTLPNFYYAAPVPLLVLLLAVRFFTALSAIKNKKPHAVKTASHAMWADSLPFFTALGLFLLSYIGLGISVWPYIVPPDITLTEAAADPSSQRFLLVGAAVLVPVVLLYTGYVYWIFRGKVTAETGYH